MLSTVVLLAIQTILATPEPVPWTLTGTSSTPVGQNAISHRVGRRSFQKDQRISLRTGASYLSRGDMRSNPGISADLGWYPVEFIAVDLVSATFFFSELNQTAAALHKSTGLVPDSQAPIARITTGTRASIAYGKLLVEALDTVVHFDTSFFLHAGMLVTDVATNFAMDAGASLLIGLGKQTPQPIVEGGGGRPLDRLFLAIDVAWLLSYERRTESDFASGPMATLGFGVLL